MLHSAFAYGVISGIRGQNIFALWEKLLLFRYLFSGLTDKVLNLY